MLAAFFDTMINGNASRGLFSLKKPANDYFSCSNNIMLYEELLQEPRDYEVVARRVADWIAKLNSSNKSRQKSLIHRFQHTAGVSIPAIVLIGEVISNF
jgi:Tfp pilus assembly protein PilZ